MSRLELGDLLSDGFRYSTKPYSRAVVLGLLILTSFLIVPMFLALGYVYRCIRRSIDGEDYLPEYGEWRRMLVEGVKLFVAYLILIIPVAAITFAAAWGSVSLGNLLNPFAAFSGMTVAMGLSFAVSLILNLYLFMAIPQVVYTGRISSVFDYHGVVERIKKIGAGRYLAVVIVVMIVAWILNLIGGLIPVVGIILISPIALLLLARVQALVFKDTLA